MSTQISKYPDMVQVICKGASALLPKGQAGVVLVSAMELLYSINAFSISWITRKGRCGMSNANVAVGKKSKGAGCLRWLGRVALGGVILLLGLAAIGAIYQGVASKRDAKTYKPVDQMVDVDGTLLRLDCRGNGSPTVVLEAGASVYSIAWVRIQDDVAKFTRVCSYDRAGMGWSDSVRGELSPKQVAGMLHVLLEKGGEQPPYLMVGHSLGGIYVRAFASLYPDDVVGMVLVDSSYENQYLLLPPEFVKLNNTQSVAFQFCRVTAPFGLVRAIKMMDSLVVSFRLTEEEKEPLLAAWIPRVRCRRSWRGSLPTANRSSSRRADITFSWMRPRW
jgi:pimeloyl-ACP methyl ester carboxylesterase